MGWKRTPGRRIHTRIALLLALIVVLPLTACGAFQDDALSSMTIERLGGSVTIQRGNEMIEVEDREALEPQDQILTSRSGRARLALEGDQRRFELQPRTEIRILSSSSLESLKGHVLGQVGEATKVTFDGVEASSSDGVFRIDRGFGSSRAASYRGDVQLFVPGEPRLHLSRLFEADVAAAALPNSKSPYEITPNDAWDQVYLQDILTLSEDLIEFSRGFRNQLEGQRPGLDYFGELAGNRDVSFMRQYLNRNVMDLLIGFTIADNAKTSLKSAFKDAFRYFDQGATWGVASAILSVTPDLLVADLNDIIEGSNAVAADGGSSEAVFTVAAANAANNGTAPPPTTSDDGRTITGEVDGNEGNDGNGNDGDGDGGGGQQEECDTLQECAEEEVNRLRPTPSPSPSEEDPEEEDEEGLLDGMLNQVGLGK